MNIERPGTIGGITQYVSRRIPGSLGLVAASTQANAAPLGLALFAPAPALNLPNRTDEFLRAMGNRRALFWKFSNYSQLFAMGALGPDELDIPRIRIQFEPKRVKNCEEAQQHLSRLKVKRGGIAKANPVLTKTQLLNSRTEEIGPGEFRFTADVSIRLNLDAKHGSFIQFPELTWSPMSDKERKALRQFYLDLMVHEMGHFWVAGMFLWHAKKTFEGSGSTRRRAENNAREQVNDHRQSLAVNINDAGDAYDLATKHGAEQSDGPEFTFNVTGKDGIPFPGGRNVILDC
jgi:hypothetical protein